MAVAKARSILKKGASPIKMALAGMNRHLLIGEADFSFSRSIIENKDVEPKNVYTTCLEESEEDGIVTIIHRSSLPYSSWNIETIATSLGFIVNNFEPFQKSKFKVYTPRKGFGDKPDDIFDIGDAELFDFKFGGRKATGTKDFQKLLGSSNDFDLGVVSSENARKYVKQLPSVLTKSASPLVMYLAEKMLLFDPYKHRSFEDAGSHPFLQSVSEINREGLENSFFVDDTQNREIYSEQGDAITKLLGSPDYLALGFLGSDNARKYVKQLPDVPTKTVSPLVTDLAEKMLVFDPSKRISVEDFMQNLAKIDMELKGFGNKSYGTFKIADKYLYEFKLAGRGNQVWPEDGDTDYSESIGSTSTGRVGTPFVIGSTVDTRAASEYAQNLPDARESEILSFFGRITNRIMATLKDMVWN